MGEILEMKERYGAYLILDEAISFGTLGATGRGLAEHLGLEGERVDAVIGSFEHAIAGVGGFCEGRKSIVGHQRLAGAGYCFSACCPPSACAAIMTMINDLTQESGLSRMESLRRNRSLLNYKLREVAAQSKVPVELVSSEDSF